MVFLFFYFYNFFHFFFNYFFSIFSGMYGFIRELSCNHFSPHDRVKFQFCSIFVILGSILGSILDSKCFVLVQGPVFI